MESIAAPNASSSRPRKKLTPRKLLKITRNKVQGRINKLRSDLADQESVLARIDERMRLLDESAKRP